MSDSMIQEGICSSVLALLIGTIAAGMTLPQTARADSGVEIIDKGDHLRIELNGELFTNYHYGNEETLRPFFHPVIGPGGVQMTRNYPMEEVPGEAHDHPHHTALFYAHDRVNGGDFWHGDTIRHKEFLELKSGDRMGSFTSRNEWVREDGQVVGTDIRTFRVYSSDNGRFLDFSITLHAPDDEDLTFGDTKEGTMAIRLASPLRVEGQGGQGTIINSEGHRNGEAWGKRAKWCDYYGPIDGKTVGVAIFDHPLNPRHPTWWHVRNYGLFAANPFGIHDFENKPQGVGDYQIPKGQKATFQYRFYLHEGDAEEADVEQHYQDWSRPTVPRSLWN